MKCSQSEKWAFPIGWISFWTTCVLYLWGFCAGLKYAHPFHLFAAAEINETCVSSSLTWLSLTKVAARFCLREASSVMMDMKKTKNILNSQQTWVYISAIFYIFLCVDVKKQMIHINWYSSDYWEKSDFSSSDICNKAFGAITCIITPKTLICISLLKELISFSATVTQEKRINPEFAK